mgnify:CR=1 FL=1
MRIGLSTTIALALTGSLATAAAAQLVFDGGRMDAAGAVERVGIASIKTAPGAPGGQLSVIDVRGVAQTRTLAETIALVPSAWAEGQPSPGAAAIDAWTLAGAPFIELIDGQRFVGRPGHISANGETIAWLHERFGTLLFSLDEVARFVMRPSATEAVVPASSSAKADTVWLVNGDRLEGFLESIGPRSGGEGFALTIDAGGTPVTIPVDQIVRAQFANPRQALAGPVAWLADGSVVRLAAIETDTQRSVLSLTASAARRAGGPAGAASESPGTVATAQFSTAELSAIAFDSSRVLPLAGLDFLSYRPIGLSRRPGPRIDAVDAIPAALGAADVLLPGPMEVEWALPTGVTRVVGTARLDDVDAVWGECVVVVELLTAGSAAREVARMKLGNTALLVPLTADLGTTTAGDRLRVRVEPGELGPIRDRVRLERVLLLR